MSRQNLNNLHYRGSFIRRQRNQPSRKKTQSPGKQKRGLMQKLLTGEVRVKVNNSGDNVKDEL
jgi:hypothetical protein